MSYIIASGKTNIRPIRKIFEKSFHFISTSGVIIDTGVSGSTDAIIAANIVTGIFIVDIIGKAFTLDASCGFISYAFARANTGTVTYIGRGTRGHRIITCIMAIARRAGSRIKISGRVACERQ